MLIPPELSLSVEFSCDKYRLEGERVVSGFQTWIETELPMAVLHFTRHNNPEAKVNLASSFRHVTETGCHFCRLDYVRRNHFSIFVFNGFHNNNFVTFRIFHYKGVSPGLFWNRHLRKGVLLS